MLTRWWDHKIILMKKKKMERLRGSDNRGMNISSPVLVFFNNTDGNEPITERPRGAPAVAIIEDTDYRGDGKFDGAGRYYMLTSGSKKAMAAMTAPRL